MAAGWIGSCIRDYLTDRRISIRKYRVGDDGALFSAVCESMDELSHWGLYQTGFTLEDAADDILSRITTWNQGEKYTFLVEELPGPVFVGNCSVEEIDFERQHASLDSGYALAEQARELPQPPGVWLLKPRLCQLSQWIGDVCPLAKNF